MVSAADCRWSCNDGYTLNGGGTACDLDFSIGDHNLDSSLV